MRLSRFFLPVALLTVTALIAFLMTQPLTSTSQSAAVTVESLPSPTTQVLETTAHDHAAPADDAAHDHTLVADVSSTDSGHQHSSAPTNASEGTANDLHAHDPGTPAVLPSGPIVSVNDPRLTPAQQNAASALLISSRAAIASFPNTTALAAGGYVSVGDNSSGLQHWVNDAYTHDGRELDPSHIETFVVNVSSGRTVGAMYTLEPGKTMANVPNIAGELTTWHVHPTICFSNTQIWRFVSFATNNSCPNGSSPRLVPPMMHVWSDDPPCGPFVGTEGHGTTSCAAHAH
ncbi:MAG: hypothetical protein QNL59_01140 [Actinomycetota bacterium]